MRISHDPDGTLDEVVVLSPLSVHLERTDDDSAVLVVATATGRLFPRVRVALYAEGGRLVMRVTEPGGITP